VDPEVVGGAIYGAMFVLAALAGNLIMRELLPHARRLADAVAERRARRRGQGVSFLFDPAPDCESCGFRGGGHRADCPRGTPPD